MKKMPPPEKVHEALSAIADDRVLMDDGEGKGEGEVYAALGDLDLTIKRGSLRPSKES